MEVQKPSHEQFKTEGANLRLTAGMANPDNSLMVNIPYDPKVFKDTNEVVFASSFSAQTGSDEMLKQQNADDVQEAVIVSGKVDISARKPSSPFP